MLTQPTLESHPLGEGTPPVWLNDYPETDPNMLALSVLSLEQIAESAPDTLDTATPVALCAATTIYNREGFARQRVRQLMDNAFALPYPPEVYDPDELAREQTMRARWREVIELRYGLRDGNRQTQAQIAKQYGCTQQNVSQLEQRALQELRYTAA